jgi:hypothetical protein
MEAALVSVATGVLKPVLGKLAALLGEEYKRFKGVHGDIRFLIDELAAMHAFLLKMSEEEDLDLQEKVWMTAVRELSYGDAARATYVATAPADVSLDALNADLMGNSAARLRAVAWEPARKRLL